MPRRPRPPCSVPGCPELTARGGRCPQHQREAEQQRGSAAERGYDSRRWARVRRAYIYAHPWCLLCGRAAVVADHHPESRRSLLARGVEDPDAWSRLRPLCTQCHNRETAAHQPGGWASDQAKPVKGL